jgi:hypothetical protein
MGRIAASHIAVMSGVVATSGRLWIRSADARGRYTIAEVDQVDAIDPNVLVVDLATGKDIWFAMGVS